MYPIRLSRDFADDNKNVTKRSKQMPTPTEIEDAVKECLRHVPFEHADNLDAPFDDFWKRVDDQDTRTNRGVHRVDEFLKCLHDKLGPFAVNRDDLLGGIFETVRDLVNQIGGN